MKKITIIVLTTILLTACTSTPKRVTFDLSESDSGGKEILGADAPFDKNYKLVIYPTDKNGVKNQYFLSRTDQSYLIETMQLRSHVPSRQKVKHEFTLDEDDWQGIDWYLFWAMYHKDIFWTEEFLNNATGVGLEINGKIFYTYDNMRLFNEISQIVKNSSGFKYNFSICEELGDRKQYYNVEADIGYFLKDACYVDMALALNDSAICQKVTPGEAYENCLGNVFYAHASQYKNFATTEFCAQFPESVESITGRGETTPVRAKCLELVQPSSSELN